LRFQNRTTDFGVLDRLAEKSDGFKEELCLTGEFARADLLYNSSIKARAEASNRKHDLCLLQEEG
jgi:hypothetical protein